MRERIAHILIVDDDEVDIRAVRRAFRELGIANPVHVANDGIEALRLLRGEGGRDRLARPILILLDLRLPRMSGMEFLQELRADDDLETSIVFVLTTSEEDADKLAAYRRHIAGYMVKSSASGDFAHVLEWMRGFLRTIEFPPALPRDRG